MILKVIKQDFLTPASSYEKLSNFFQSSTTWAPKATAKELQQEALFLLFCKDWVTERMFNCYCTVQSVSTAHALKKTI